MCGQVWVDAIPTNETAELFRILSEDYSLNVEQVESEDEPRYRCTRGHNCLMIGCDVYPETPEETYVLLGYPPYTIRPWRWRGDFQLFDDVQGVIKEMAIPLS